jgi:hypothetical protein
VRIEPEPLAAWSGSVTFDETSDFSLWVKALPPRWAVVRLDGTEGRPAQLLAVKNVRRLLAERLSPEFTAAPGRRIDYRSLVRRVSWIEVGNQLEADWVYLCLVRQAFPQTYRGTLGLSPPWFVHLDPDEQFPKVVKTSDPTLASGRLIGPMADKHSAGRLVELIESNFELCRYPHVLAQAPSGRPCAYKEMGRCPAPCDGTISMGMYRQMAERAAVSAARPTNVADEARHRMTLAATETRFESAGKIKQYLTELQEMSKPAFRWLGQLEAFQFLAVGGTRVEGWYRLMLVRGGEITPLASVRISPDEGHSKRGSSKSNRPQGCTSDLSDALQVANELLAAPVPRPSTPSEVEHMGIVTQLLFATRADVVFLRAQDVSPSAVVLAAKEVSTRVRRATAEAPDGNEPSSDAATDLPSTLPGIAPPTPSPTGASNRPHRELTDIQTDLT